MAVLMLKQITPDMSMRLLGKCVEKPILCSLFLNTVLLGKVFKILCLTLFHDGAGRRKV
jgi:hypothetical protein